MSNIKIVLENSTFFGALICVAFYEIGILMKKKWKLAIFNPLLLAILFTIMFLKIVHVDYKSFEKGAQYISYLLTPATVCLAVPLYEQFEALKKNWKAICAGIMTGALTSMGSVFLLSILFHLTHTQYVTLLPKSITTAIGMGVAEELGGMVTITVAVIVVTGVLGNMIAETVCHLFRIEEPVAKGIAIGCASHAVGTAKAMEIGEMEGAMSSLSIAVSGLITVILAPVFSQFW